MGLVALIARRSGWLAAWLGSLVLDLLPLATVAVKISRIGVDMMRFVPALIDWIGNWK
jgi:hypothetical protein